MTKLKYILLIAGSIIVGIIIGWFIFSGGTMDIKLPDFNIHVDTTYKSYTDTLTITKTRTKFDTVRLVDSIIIVKDNNLHNLLQNGEPYPLNIGNNLYLTPSFESKFELISQKDTINGIYYFPNMTTSALWRHGQDSIVWNERVIYKDYWYNNLYVEVAKDVVILFGGYLLNDLSRAK